MRSDMGNGYNYQQQHPNFHHRRSVNNFMPMLCRVSMRDIKLPKWHERSSSSTGADPSSPKVSCIGQVKRNSRVTGFPTSYKFTPNTTANKTQIHHLKYTKLKKLFSGKHLTTTPTATAASSARITCGRRRPRSASDGNNDYVEDLVKMGEIDPPLPVVIKKKFGPAGGEVNLWMRRSGGTAAAAAAAASSSTLRGLQIQPIHIPSNIHLLPPTTL
ncbi:hypothetical protein RJ640_001127 [Escallonia rubra]|uniref:Uncharacterized protein n=1 Tax=Escallonia rubra TaxID=112253 RepID=A0AA88RR04_9ASTE|nr:hypothetical protein RJ640_001127 [Escallonia rubra]